MSSARLTGASAALHPPEAHRRRDAPGHEEGAQPEGDAAVQHHVHVQTRERQVDTCVHSSENPGQVTALTSSSCLSILFADIVGFTQLSSSCSAQELVKLLNELFARFDKLAAVSVCVKKSEFSLCFFALESSPFRP